MKNDEVLHRPLGLTHIVENVSLQRQNKKKTFPYQGIWIASGSQGAGKTLYIISVLRSLYMQYPNIKIYSNIALYGIPFKPYTGIDDFEDTNGEDGIVYVIDEIHCLYSSLESRKMSGSYLTVWSQNRKNKRLILGTSQRWTRVAKPIREQALINIECRGCIFPFLRKYRIVDASLFDDNGKLPPDTKVDRWHFYVPTAYSMLTYDTSQIVKSTEELTKEEKGE